LLPFAGRVGIGRQVMSQGRVGVDDHRAEFEAVKRLAVLANPPMPVKDRPTVSQLYRDRDQAEQRQPENNRRKCGGGVEVPFAASANDAGRIGSLVPPDANLSGGKRLRRLRTHMTVPIRLRQKISPLLREAGRK
jgi:hypothetical protein